MDETKGLEWQVIVMEAFYPSVFLFATEEEAKAKYEQFETDEYDDRLVTISKIIARKGGYDDIGVEWAYK